MLCFPKYCIETNSRTDYDPTFHDNFVAGVGTINLLRHMFWLERIAKLVPEWLLARVSSVVAMFWAEKMVRAYHP